MKLLAGFKKTIDLSAKTGTDADLDYFLKTVDTGKGIVKQLKGVDNKAIRSDKISPPEKSPHLRHLLRSTLQAVSGAPTVGCKTTAHTVALPDALPAAPEPARSAHSERCNPVVTPVARPNVDDLAVAVLSAVEAKGSASEALHGQLLARFCKRLDPARQAQFDAARDTMRDHGVHAIRQLALLVYLGESLGMDQADLRRFANEGIFYAARGPGITHTTLLPTGSKDKPNHAKFHKLLGSLMREIASRRDPSCSSKTPLVDVDRIVSEYHGEVMRTVVDNVKKASNDQFCCVDEDSATGERLSHDDAIAIAYHTYEARFPHQGGPLALYAASTHRTACITEIVDLLCASDASVLPGPSTSDGNSCTNTCTPTPSRRISMSSPSPAVQPGPLMPIEPAPLRPPRPPAPARTTPSMPTPSEAPKRASPSRRSMEDDDHIATPLPTSKVKQKQSLPGQPTSLQWTPIKWSDSEINSSCNKKLPYSSAQYILSKLSDGLSNDQSSVKKQINDLRQSGTLSPQSDRINFRKDLAIFNRDRVTFEADRIGFETDLIKFNEDFAKLQGDLYAALPLNLADADQTRINAQALDQIASLYQSVLRQTGLFQMPSPDRAHRLQPLDAHRYMSATLLSDFVDKVKPATAVARSHGITLDANGTAPMAYLLQSNGAREKVIL